MRNLGDLERSPDRRIYDAARKTREILHGMLAAPDREVEYVGTREIVAAIQEACNQITTGTGSRSRDTPLLVLSAIAGINVSEIKGGVGLDEAAVGTNLNMWHVGRGVRVARAQLHEAAICQNELNAEALELVSAMEWIDAPFAREDSGSPLTEHKVAASDYLLIREREREAATGKRKPFWDRIEVLVRLDEFLNVVARNHSEAHDGRSGFMYLDAPYAIQDSLERGPQVCRLIIEPAKQVIAGRMAEIAAVIVETSALKTRVAARLHLPTARSMVHAVGVSQGALQSLR